MALFDTEFWRGFNDKIPQLAQQMDGRVAEQMLAQAAIGPDGQPAIGNPALGQPGQDMSMQALLMPGEQGGMPTPEAGRMNPAQLAELQKGLPMNRPRPQAGAAAPASGRSIGDLVRVGAGAQGKVPDRTPLSLYRILNGGV